MKVGIIGAGGIARKMAATLKELEKRERVETAVRQMCAAKEMDAEPVTIPQIECTAVAARELGRAEAFAQNFGFRRAYGSYEELLADKEIDLVYIALPHSHHCQWTKAALEAGKHVLCEKAFAVSEAQAREMIDLARNRGLLLAEAIWTRYMPSRRMIEDLVSGGTIGSIRTLSASLGYPVSGAERMIRPELAGGALLDLTVYPLNFASMVLGDRIRNLSASCIMDEHGVDGQDQVTIAYEEGAMATLFASMYTMTDRAGWIYGEKGALEVENINNPQKIRVYRHKDHALYLEEEYQIPPQISGYEYEVITCALAIEKGACECGEMPHDETIEIMRQMDAIRTGWKCL